MTNQPVWMDESLKHIEFAPAPLTCITTPLPIRRVVTTDEALKDVLEKSDWANYSVVAQVFFEGVDVELTYAGGRLQKAAASIISGSVSALDVTERVRHMLQVPQIIFTKHPIVVLGRLVIIGPLSDMTPRQAVLSALTGSRIRTDILEKIGFVFYASPTESIQVAGALYKDVWENVASDFFTTNFQIYEPHTPHGWKQLQEMIHVQYINAALSDLSNVGSAEGNRCVWGIEGILIHSNDATEHLDQNTDPDNGAAILYRFVDKDKREGTVVKTEYFATPDGTISLIVHVKEEQNAVSNVPTRVSVGAVPLNITAITPPECPDLAPPCEPLWHPFCVGAGVSYRTRASTTQAHHIEHIWHALGGGDVYLSTCPFCESQLVLNIDARCRNPDCPGRKAAIARRFFSQENYGGGYRFAQLANAIFHKCDTIMSLAHFMTDYHHPARVEIRKLSFVDPAVDEILEAIVHHLRTVTSSNPAERSGIAMHFARATSLDVLCDTGLMDLAITAIQHTQGPVIKDFLAALMNVGLFRCSQSGETLTSWYSTLFPVSVHYHYG